MDITQINHYYGNKYELKSVFLDFLREFGVIGVACKKAGISRTTYHRWLYEDSAFWSACNKAMEETLKSKGDLIRRIPEQKQSNMLKVALMCED
ncbi:MAG: hypothetical protein WCO12_02875 [bacterium]